eukprot:712519-Prymnesium_polylepis.1
MLTFSRRPRGGQGMSGAWRACRQGKGAVGFEVQWPAYWKAEALGPRAAADMLGRSYRRATGCRHRQHMSARRAKS